MVISCRQHKTDGAKQRRVRNNGTRGERIPQKHKKQNIICNEYNLWNGKKSFLIFKFKTGFRKDARCCKPLSINCSMSRLSAKILQLKLRKSLGNETRDEHSRLASLGSCLWQN